MTQGENQVVKPSATARGAAFWLALLVLIGAAGVVVATFAGWLKLDAMLGPLPLHHWSSITGAAFIALFTPFYYVMKRRHPAWYRNLLAIHVFGNLLSFVLISAHFAHQSLAFPFETGLALYLAVLVLVTTGFVQRFRLYSGPVKGWRFWHTAFAVAFFLVVVVHVPHGLMLFERPIKIG